MVEIRPRILPDQQKVNKSMSNMMENFTKHSTSRVSVYKPFESDQNDFNKTQFLNQMSSSRISGIEKNTKNALSSMLFTINAKEDPYEQNKKQKINF